MVFSESTVWRTVMRIGRILLAGVEFGLLAWGLVLQDLPFAMQLRRDATAVADAVPALMAIAAVLGILVCFVNPLKGESRVNQMG